MFKKLFVSSTSACFELDNKNPYYSPQKYKVVLNGKEVGEEKDSNVFSLFNLTPNTEYTVGTTLGGFTLKFKTDKETGTVNVKDLGAKGDGVTDDTYPVQMAIDSCPKGGRVIIPEGSFYVRPITLASDITVEILKGGELLGDIVEEHYPYVPAKIEHDDGTEEILASWEGNPYPCHKSFVSAYKQKNIKVIGEGTINGNADKSTWWATPKGRAVARPRLVTLNKCEDVTFHGVTCKNSAAWNLHPFFSKNLGFYDLRIQNPDTGPTPAGRGPASGASV
ncbi:MAG: glycoside hydrolase family 28 protein, partial [Clostridia bacterium]|nr:glycoside hydrolase family 28 protein [Clostridia bacterium]